MSQWSQREWSVQQLQHALLSYDQLLFECSSLIKALNRTGLLANYMSPDLGMKFKFNVVAWWLQVRLTDDLTSAHDHEHLSLYRMEIYICCNLHISQIHQSQLSLLSHISVVNFESILNEMKVN